ncbi:FABL211Wp [Eremothecium gossypii FDAG1]|nr:FABL211Wp [Eremothecium gossypii FDAG1]
MRDIESTPLIEEHEHLEQQLYLFYRYQYRLAICWLFCCVSHLSFCSCILARTWQLPQDEHVKKFISMLEYYDFYSSTACVAISIPMVPYLIMKRWEFTILPFFLIPLIVYASMLWWVGDCLLNLFPLVKSWSLDDIATYCIWEGCILCAVVVLVPPAASHILFRKAAPTGERAPELYLGAHLDAPGNDAELNDDSLSMKSARTLPKLKLVKMFLAGLVFPYLLIQVFFVIRAYSGSILRDISGKSELYAHALLVLLYAKVVRLLSMLFCICYSLISSKTTETVSVYWPLVFLYQSGLVMDSFYGYIVSTVDLVG